MHGIPVLVKDEIDVGTVVQALQAVLHTLDLPAFVDVPMLRDPRALLEQTLAGWDHFR